MKIKLFFIGLAVLSTITLGSFLSGRANALPASLPTTVANDVTKCNQNFFGLKPWYAYLPDSEIGVRKTGDAAPDPCGIKCFNIFVQKQPNDCGETASDVPGIVLAIIDDLLRIAGLVAVVFVLIGAFQYVGSRGNAERAASAQSTIISALTGLAVALVATAFVAFLGNRLH
jgi:hypothetical protein